jgi:hypothetical protein
MSPQPCFEISFVGGPYDGRVRHVDCCPYELATPVALPVQHWRQMESLTGDATSDELAIYQLKNHNGDWQYDYLWTTTADALGLETTTGWDADSSELLEPAVLAC